MRPLDRTKRGGQDTKEKLHEFYIFEANNSFSTHHLATPNSSWFIVGGGKISEQVVHSLPFKIEHIVSHFLPFGYHPQIQSWHMKCPMSFSNDSEKLE